MNLQSITILPTEIIGIGIESRFTLLPLHNNDLAQQALKETVYYHKTMAWLKQMLYEIREKYLA